jgi:RNA polymerase sigma factor (TIGR02999 family)
MRINTSHWDGRRREITDALAALQNGAPDAMERLMPLVYDELRGIAHRQLRAERTEHTLSTTDLVHEAYLRLVDQNRTQWTDRAHFYALASRAMRRILIDYARRHRALRRSGTWIRTSIDTNTPDLSAALEADELLALDDALKRLSDLDPRLGRVVECRYFGGLTEAETAEALGVTPRTAARDWVRAKGWLYSELRPDGG